MKKQIVILVLTASLTLGQGRPPVDKVSLLRDVDITGLADGQVLQWVLSQGKWRPGSITGVTDATLPFTDIITNNASTAKHGFMAKGTGSLTTFYRSDMNQGTVKDSDLGTTDVTSNNVSTSKHGFAPKSDGNASHYLDGTGAYSTPAGGGGGGGDFSTNTTTSVDGEGVVFNGTGGKSGKRFTGSGVVKATSGVLSTITLDGDATHYLDGTGSLTTPNPASVAARVYNSANLAIPNNTLTALTFDSERRDDGNLHSVISNTGRLTVPSSDWYTVSATCEFANNSTGYRAVDIRVNGTDYITAQFLPAVSGGVTIVTTTTSYYLTANDYVEVVVRHTAGGSLLINASPKYSPEFSIVKTP